MQEIQKKVSTTSGAARWTTLRNTAAVVLAGGSVAGAQTSTGGAAAVGGLGLDTMITTVSEGIKALISTNGPILMLAVLPVMAFYFIWNKLRGLV